jgi:L-fucose mutarotase/ribose pyranase (RbsD/FucU family)
LIIADANFPGGSLSRGTAHGRPVRIGGDTAQVVEAVLPLDTFVEDAVGRV